MPDQRDQASEVLEFWFVETRPHQWFAKDPAFDDLVRQRFLSLTRRAIAGELDAWDAEPTRDLALVLLGKSPRLLGRRNNHGEATATSFCCRGRDGWQRGHAEGLSACSDFPAPPNFPGWSLYLIWPQRLLTRPETACSSCGHPACNHLASRVSRADWAAELVDTGFMQLVP